MLPKASFGRFLAPPERRRLTEQEASEIAAPTMGSTYAARLLQCRHRNEIFQIGASAVLKVYTVEGSSLAARTRWALEALTTSGLEVPRLLDSGTLEDGTPWTLETLVPHRHPNVALTDETQRARHRALGQWLPRLHGYTRFPTFGAWTANEAATFQDYVAAEGQKQVRLLQESPNVPAAAGAHALRRLRALIDTSSGALVTPVLVHGSYTAANAVATPASRRASDPWKINGVFDFEQAHSGDPAEDFAWIAFYGLSWPPFQVFCDAYRGSAHLGPSASARICLWTLRAALETLEWAPALGDQQFARRALAVVHEVAESTRGP